MHAGLTAEGGAAGGGADGVANVSWYDQSLFGIWEARFLICILGEKKAKARLSTKDLAIHTGGRQRRGRQGMKLISKSRLP